MGKSIKGDCKREYRRFVESVWKDFDNGVRTRSVKPKEMRANICKWLFNAAQKNNDNKKLLRTSFINFGLYLPMSGEKDGDKDSLHQRYQETNWFADYFSD